MKTIRRSSILCLTLSAASLTACASLFGGEEVKVRPISNMSGLTSEPRDPLYESAVTAINERDYAKALDYLQEAKSKNPRNIKALNALGVVYDKLGRFDLSARYYAQAREIDPASRVVVANLDYSRALQGLMASNKQVVTLELPSNFNPDTASKPTVLASVPPTSVAATSQSVASSTVVSVPPAPVPTTLPTAATVRREPQVVQAELKQEPAPKRVVPAAVDFGGVVKNAMLRNANVTIQPMATPTARLPVERPVRATETSPLAVPVAAKTPAERNETNIVTLSSALVAPAAQALKPVASKPAAAEPAPAASR